MVTLPLVLLASSSTITDGGVVRSCLLGGLHKLPHGLETVGCSNDMSSDSMELVIGGGSTTVDGPKNDGISLEVVTGVFKSPLLLLWILLLFASLLTFTEFGKLRIG